MLYRIASTYLSLEGADNNAYLKRRMRAYEIMENGEQSLPVLHIRVKENSCIDVPAGRDFRRHDAWYWFDRGADGYSAVMQITEYRVNILKFDINRDCTEANIEYVDIKDYTNITTDELIHFAVGAVFSFSQVLRNAVVLHASSVAYKGEAVLFSAPPGTGKSTHTGLWKQYFTENVTLFNDDTPVLCLTEDGVLACGTPWSGKTEINENHAYPLKGIVFLKQAKENTIRRLSTVEAAVQMLNETKSIVFDTLMEKELDIIGNVLKHVPVYELCCNISKEAVELVKDTIFRE